ncbi:MAG: trimeric intracellular cation channel family protein [Clostridia bacterium]|nr:trimeric intracellular cation channel family protein [Clostridia bacterium]
MSVLQVLEIIGLVAFALSSVFVGIEYELDIFGIFFIALCTSLGGGIIRDVVLGIEPPLNFLHSEYVITVVVTVAVSLIVFKILDKKLKKSTIRVIKKIVDLVDAIGLGVFTVSGCQAAVNVGFGDNFILMLFVGLTTAVGGGIVRDLLAGRKPVVVRKEIYALASIVGTVVFYFIHDKMSSTGAMYLTAALIAIIRVIASLRRINLSYALRNDDMKADD